MAFIKTEQPHLSAVVSLRQEILHFCLFCPFFSLLGVCVCVRVLFPTSKERCVYLVSAFSYGRTTTKSKSKPRYLVFKEMSSVLGADITGAFHFSEFG